MPLRVIEWMKLFSFKRIIKNKKKIPLEKITQNVTNLRK